MLRLCIEKKLGKEHQKPQGLLWKGILGVWFMRWSQENWEKRDKDLEVFAKDYKSNPN